VQDENFAMVSGFYLLSLSKNSEWFYKISAWLLTSGLAQVLLGVATALSDLLGIIVFKDSLL
jgi:hypothetical protein